MKAPNRIRFFGILFGILGVVLFSTKAILVKLAYEYQVETLELLLFRMVFSFPFYVVILLLSRNKVLENVRLTDFLAILFFGFLGYYLASYFDFVGLRYIKAGLERIILFIYPTFVVLLGYFFMGQRVTKVQATAIIITYIGVFIAFFNEIEVSGKDTLLGAGLIVLSALTYASYLVGSGWLIPKFGVLRFTCYAMIVSTICVAVHYSLNGDWRLWDFPWQVYFYGLLMAIISTLIPSFLVSESIKRLGASNFSILGSLGPVSTILLAFVFLGEALSFLQIFGMLVVISGVTFLSLVETKKSSK